MSLRSVFKQQGGFSLVKNYAQNHVLLYAAFMFAVLPKNKKGLEMLRECVDFKIYSHLKRKYRKVLAHSAKSESQSVAPASEKPKIIWFCWLQGIENAPPLVKKCYENLVYHCSDYTVNIVTAQNLSQYTDLPDYILKKWQRGIISAAHFSDILRTNLLVNHGGFWIDSTVLLTAKIPEDIENAPLFLFRTYKPGSNGHCTNISSWFISSMAQNPVLVASQNLLFAYWKKRDSLCHYFLYHFFVEMALTKYSGENFTTPKYTNETPHFLLFELGNQVDKVKWESIVAQSFCHKLTNKLSEEVKTRNNTFYKYVIGENY